MIMVVAKRFSVKDVESLVGEGFLKRYQLSEGLRREGEETAYVAGVAVKTFTVVFPFELTVRGRNGLLLYGQVAPSTLPSCGS